MKTLFFLLFLSQPSIASPSVVEIGTTRVSPLPSVNSLRVENESLKSESARLTADMAVLQKLNADWSRRVAAGNVEIEVLNERLEMVKDTNRRGNNIANILVLLIFALAGIAGVAGIMARFRGEKIRNLQSMLVFRDNQIVGLRRRLCVTVDPIGSGKTERTA